MLTSPAGRIFVGPGYFGRSVATKGIFMPIVRTASKLMYYAHVPKCGGSAVEAYLQERFQTVAFLDKKHHKPPAPHRWSRTSPQHIHLEVLNRLFPEGFFDQSFAVVRHPLARIVSAYHFQLEVEQSPAARTGFSQWLDTLPEIMEKDPFAFDNHIRPMVELVPKDAKIFHLEHGLDAIVPWLDALIGDTTGPRALRKTNERKGRGVSTEKVTPEAADVDRIVALYADDFERFGYLPEQPKPLAPPPVLSPEFLAARDAEQARQARPISWLRERLGWSDR